MGVYVDKQSVVPASSGKGVSFNNAGTNLESDNVEDAIKEVNSNLSDLEVALSPSGLFKIRGIFSGYVTGSGGYIDWFVPLNMSGITNIVVNQIEELVVYYLDGTREVYSDPSQIFDTSYFNIMRFNTGFIAELKYLTAKSGSKLASVLMQVVFNFS